MALETNPPVPLYPILVNNFIPIPLVCFSQIPTFGPFPATNVDDDFGKCEWNGDGSEDNGVLLLLLLLYLNEAVVANVDLVLVTG